MDWLLPQKVAVGGALRDAVGGHPLVVEILARRGIHSADEARAFLDPAHYTPAPPTALPDVDVAAERLWGAIQADKRILIWGDFDVDGQTSTALLVDALRALSTKVIYHIPLRLKHGHGVQADVLIDMIRKEQIDLILTCDTGVAAHDAVDTAQVNGVPVLITDHHALPDTLPDAPAIVNPQRLPEGHPLRDLPGVGVAFKLIQQLYTLAGREDEALQFLDLVALGIVADVAIQRLDTRYLLQLGLEMLRNPSRIGLQALIQSAGVDPGTLSSDTIGYQIGPRLNALGRLDNARLAVELLTTGNELHAHQIAAQLEALNNKRRQIEDQIYGAAQGQIVKDLSVLNFEALVLGNAHWHPGVIGIVASRLVEQYERPVVMLSIPAGEPARGSARSVPGVDIGAAIAANADLLVGHGGHPGAAGLSLDPDLIPQFRRRLSNTIAETRDPSVKSGYTVDAVITLDDLSMELVEELNRLAPFGAGNPPVHLMMPRLRTDSHAVFGINGMHRRVIVEDESGQQREVTWWRGSEHPMPVGTFDLLAIPRINDYRGRRSLQLEWVDSRLSPGVEVEVGPRYEVVDLRGQDVQVDDLIRDGTGVWVEGIAPDRLPFGEEHVCTRYQPRTCATLVIWTAPPGPQELEQMLEETQARIVTVVARHVPEYTPPAFLKRLAGLVKYARRNYDGEASVLQLAGATAQREVTVRKGLEWMVARGQIGLEWPDSDRVHFIPGGDADEAALEPLQDAIKALLAEAAAYRAYFCRADLSMFFRE